MQESTTREELRLAHSAELLAPRRWTTSPYGKILGGVFSCCETVCHEMVRNPEKPTSGAFRWQTKSITCRLLPAFRIAKRRTCGADRFFFAERERVRLVRKNAADEPVSRAIRVARSAPHPVSCPRASHPRPPARLKSASSASWRGRALPVRGSRRWRRERRRACAWC